MDNKIKIDKLKIIKKLGSGIFGTTFLVKYKNKEYAMKIEKISEDNLEYNLKNPDWREIDFSINFANNYPDQFITLYTYDIISNCHHKQNYVNNEIPRHLPNDVIERLEKKEKSNYCIRKIYSLIDTTFSKIYDIITREQYLSCIAQISYMAYLMKKNDYTHNDLHGENLGVLYVNKNKILNIFNLKIPTFGLQFKAIDYGLVLNSKYELNKTEKKTHKQQLNNEISRIIRRAVYFQSNTTSTKIITPDKCPLIFNKIKKNKLFNSIKNLCSNNENCFLLFQIIFPFEFQKEYFQEKFNKNEVMYPILKIDLVDFIFLLNNTSNYKKIIKFCFHKLL